MINKSKRKELVLLKDTDFDDIKIDLGNSVNENSHPETNW